MKLAIKTTCQRKFLGQTFCQLPGLFQDFSNIDDPEVASRDFITKLNSVEDTVRKESLQKYNLNIRLSETGVKK